MIVISQVVWAAFGRLRARLGAPMAAALIVVASGAMVAVAVTRPRLVLPLVILLVAGLAGLFAPAWRVGAGARWAIALVAFLAACWALFLLTLP